uniref:sulfatase-like hydrolase/transferase n=1 Tax=uncultured Allisonella sp. TaxID=339338 RepID=UPI0026702C2C|nr:sulfatase-like hydrolase/transferase [uncultured Allisonella sp.]
MLYVRAKVNQIGHPEGNVFLIIGESANRDHMKAFNPEYMEETTPWQSVMRNKQEFFFFPKTYACFTQTAQTIRRMITGMNQYNHQSPDYLVTLIDAAKAAGYTTWWCANHKANDYQTGYIMQTADHVVEVPAPTGDDAQLLDVMDTIPQEGHHFVVLHIMGSHLRYGDRYPTGFPVIPGNNKKISEYDTSHSEDMKYTHGTGHFTFDMTRIPLWIYLSPSYQQKHKEKAESLRRHESCVFTNDLVFDTLCGLIGADNYGRTEAYDLSSPSYALTEKEALTMHGKMHIAEDMQ